MSEERNCKADLVHESSERQHTMCTSMVPHPDRDFAPRQVFPGEDSQQNHSAAVTVAATFASFFGICTPSGNVK